jgi:hypothetical protein
MSQKPDYCTQNDGNCETCSLVNYGRDCQNIPIVTDEQAKKTLRPVVESVVQEAGLRALGLIQ